MDSDDYLKRASQAFNKLGHRIRTTVGVGVGSVSLELARTALAPGDTLRARIALALPEPTRASRLVFAVRATQGFAQIGGRGKQPVVRTDSVVVWKQHVELSGERDYRDGETFEAEIVIPSDVLDLQPRMPDGTLGQVVSAVQAISSAARLPLAWRAMALLHVPWKRNIKKVLDLSVSKG